MKKTFFALFTATIINASMAVADVVLINAFEVPAGERDAVIAAWEKAHEFLSNQPGYIDTALHGAITSEARFELVNIAHWESTEAFTAATQAMHAAHVFTPPAGTRANAFVYTVLRAD